MVGQRRTESCQSWRLCALTTDFTSATQANFNSWCIIGATVKIDPRKRHVSTCFYMLFFSSALACKSVKLHFWLSIRPRSPGFSISSPVFPRRRQLSKLGLRRQKWWIPKLARCCSWPVKSLSHWRFECFKWFDRLELQQACGLLLRHRHFRGHSIGNEQEDVEVERSVERGDPWKLHGSCEAEAWKQLRLTIDWHRLT